MKLYKNLVNAVAETLREILNNSRYTDRALEKLFKQHPVWGSRDRRFVAEAVYDIVRNYRLYAELAQSPKNFWFITAVWLVLKEIELPAWQEFKHVDPAYILSQKEKLKNELALIQSYPDWMWQLGIKELGKENWEKEAIAMNTQAPVVLRLNTLKTTPQKFEEAFKMLNILLKKTAEIENGYELLKRENLFQNKYFKEGWFELQDAGSQMIGEFINPKSNELVVDACAGAGGKSLHLAALMKNKGKIISMDVEAWKLEELKKRAKRAGAFNIETRLAENNEISKSPEIKADKVLLDVPCSGLGVIKRNPDTKWKLTEESIEKTKILQKKILAAYSDIVKPAGSLYYCTCSILPTENSEQVSEFLKSNPNFTFVKEKTVLPSKGYDGFYMCELKRS